MADILCFLIDGQPFATELPIFRFARNFKVNTAIGVCFGMFREFWCPVETFGFHRESLMLAGLKAGHIHQPLPGLPGVHSPIQPRQMGVCSAVLLSSTGMGGEGAPVSKVDRIRKS